MKTFKILAILALMTVSASAQAFWVQGSVNVSGTEVQGIISNNSMNYMQCNIKTVGFFPNGQFLYAFTNGVVVAPGTYAYAYVYTSYPNYFSGGNATAWCTF